MPIDPINKIVLENQKYLISLQKENKELKKILKNIIVNVLLFMIERKDYAIY